jgi:uncharacterized protein with von Willebrand factor type A (vWA) domain
MDKRMVEFIRAIRAAGVRVSLAESEDAMRAADVVGVLDPTQFKSTMKTTLVKDSKDFQIFDYFYPLFFSSNKPPMENIPDNLTQEEQNMLQQALRSLAGQMQAIKDLIQQMLEGRNFTDEQLDQMGQDAGMNQAGDMYQRPWFERRMNRQAGMQQLNDMIDQLLDMLAQMGMDEDRLDQLREMMEGNADALSKQISNYVGSSMAEEMANSEPQTKPDLMDVPFTRLGQEEIDQIREEIRRLAARLRSRASLRQKRAKAGTPDPRRTLRANMRYGGTPIELKRKTRHVKPRLIVICDVSTSVRYCTEFLLTLIYELHDQAGVAGGCHGEKRNDQGIDDTPCGPNVLVHLPK